MCDVWGGLVGMDETPLYSSDGARGHQLHPREEEEEKGGESGDHDEESTEELRSDGWRRTSDGKRKRKSSEVGEGMRAISSSMHEIAEAFKAAKTTHATDYDAVAADATREVLKSLDDLTQSVNAQTVILSQLVQHLSQNTGSNNTSA